MVEKLFDLMEKKKEYELSNVLACNKRTEQFGLFLTQEEAKSLVLYRNQSLKKHQRIEFGNGILDQLIDLFCDSQYLNQSEYLETLAELQDIFYLFKNESQDKLTDSELLHFMREQFETVCMGDTEYLAQTCLERFAYAIRGGYKGYQASEGRGEYEKISEEQRWDKNLYMQVVKELFWE